MSREAMLTGLIIAGLGLGGTVSMTSEAQAFGGRGGEIPSFQSLDADGNGEVTKEELANYKDGRFDAADADDDGFLTTDEITAMVEERIETRVARMIERHDDDGDGKLSAAEIGPGPRRGERLFDMVDADESGSVSEAEYEEAMAWRQSRGKRRGHGFGHGDGQRRGGGDGHGFWRFSD